MTLTRYRQLGDKAKDELAKRILNNFKATEQIILACKRSNIVGYRFSSNIAPLITHPSINIKLQDLPYYEFMAKIATRIASHKDSLRFSFHPSEYITLTSDDPAAIANSLSDLELHGELADLFGFQRSYWNPINIHIRKDGDKQVLRDKFLANYNKLSDSVRSRLVLENNDNANGVWSAKSLCETFQIPITFDVLHHSILSGGLSEQQAFELCYATWPTTPLFHYSESDDGSKSHADLPKNKPNDYGKDVYWDVELKFKNLAIQKILKI